MKIIFKVLSLRLHSKMDMLIFDCQSAFIKDQMIFDSFISTTEIISFCNRNKLSEVLCKIDFKKAFDSVSWDSLRTSSLQRF